MKTKETLEEDEANYFALCILMPKPVFIQVFNSFKWDLSENDNNIEQISSYFGVSKNAVISRISHLKLLQYV